MIAVQKWIEEKGLKSKLILQIHDELIMEVPEDEVDLVKENLPKIMDSVTELHVPLIAEVASETIGKPLINKNARDQPGVF